MDIEKLQEFFLWCTLVNSGIYALTAVAILTLRDFLCKVHEKMFGFDQETTLKSTQKYLANYKLLITAFNFTPWIVILIIK